MEPLRGGKLAKASGELSAAMQSLRPEETVPGWAFRFLQSIPGVTVVLSGMSDLEQLKANIITWETDKPLNGEEFDTLVKYADEETKREDFPVRPAITAPVTVRRSCPYRTDSPCIMNIRLRAEALLRRWQWAVCRRKSVLQAVSAAGAASRFVPSRLKYPR